MKLNQVVAIIALASLSAAASGQTGVGRIQGVVRDASGAVVPAADVTVTNSATQVRNETANVTLLGGGYTRSSVVDIVRLGTSLRPASFA